jgi:predicted ATPase
MSAAKQPIPFVTRVRIKNYKSIADCDVTLGPLTVLLGLNASGKSNFLDALRFVRDCLADGPLDAVQARGGIDEVLCRVPELTTSLSIELDVVVPWGPDPDQRAEGTYGFTIEATRSGRQNFAIASEHCLLRWSDKTRQFTVEGGRLEDPDLLPNTTGIVAPGTLHLPTAGSRPAFAPLLGGLRNLFFYDPVLSELRAVRQARPATVLGEDGAQLGDVLGNLSPATKERIDAYMSAIVPNLKSVDRSVQGSYTTVEMKMATSGGNPDHTFLPDAMSDGTIRAIGLLTALFQPATLDGTVRMVAVEEPELALHPMVGGALFDALTETSERVQVLATSQSMELFDRREADPDMIRVVTMVDGITMIGEVDEVSRSIAADGLATLGELFRNDQFVLEHRDESR